MVIPEENRKDLADIPENILAKLDVRPVRWIDQVLDIALQSRPMPKIGDGAEPGESASAPESATKVGGALEGTRAH